MMFLLAAATGCAKMDRSEPPAANVAAAGPSGTPSADRAQIVTVSMTVRVSDLRDAGDKVRREIESRGGYVEGSNFVAGEDGSSSMDVRVPAAKASETRAALRAMGTLTAESETVQDVTEQRADLGARLHAARTQEDRLLDIMKNRTGSIGDLIDSEKELARVRENIEKLEAEQRTMESKIAMATIHLTLTTPSTAAWQTPGHSVAQSWHAGVRGAEAIATWLAMAVAALAPTLVPLFALFALLIVIVRRARSKKTMVA
ncbi:MAG TPA: DUF4349 domain-containing protein [Polyangiaceae bacterium]